MTNYRLYQTKPLECWKRMKELKSKLRSSIWDARKEGRLLVMGVNHLAPILAGIGKFKIVNMAGPHFRGQMDSPDEAIASFETAEATGFPRDLCSSALVSLGSILNGVFLKSPSGENLKPDLVLGHAACEDPARFYAWVARYYGIPFLQIEQPRYPENRDRGAVVDYLASQMGQAIEFLERTTGKKYNDEALINAVTYEWQARVLWARICELNKAIPAPLDQNMLMGLVSTFQNEARYTQEAIEFYQLVLDEVQDRVNNQVAALATERCRLFLVGAVPWYIRGIFRYTHKFGALFIGSLGTLGTWSSFTLREDSTWEVAKTPKERGRNLKNREDALRALAELQVVYQRAGPGGTIHIEGRTQEICCLVRDWYVDGVVFHLDRGCRMNSTGLLEVKSGVQEKGISTMVFEANHADIREFTPSMVFGNFDSYLETLGLTPIPD